jgi:DNA modification methylase
MALTEQKITDRYALYCGDSMEVLAAMPDERMHLSIYSPPFAGLYNYSSNERDFSNVDDYDSFLRLYGLLVEQLHRVTMPGRMTAVHCMDVPSGNTGNDSLRDFPGDIIRLHEARGWKYVARYHVWKEPFGVYIRTMQKNLRHCTVVEDASRCSCAHADYLLMFRRSGKNPLPIEHPIGLTDYAGAREVPKNLMRYRGHQGKQTANKYSQWVWRQYASAFWDDVRIDRVLPYRDAGEPDDEKHVHPLQLDVIERAVVLWSNPGETVLTPFMGVGSEVFGAVVNDRRGIGVELKPSYYRQAIKNLAAATDGSWRPADQSSMSADGGVMDDDDTEEIAPPEDRGMRPKHEQNTGDTRTVDMFASR